MPLISILQLIRISPRYNTRGSNTSYCDSCTDGALTVRYDFTTFRDKHEHDLFNSKIKGVVIDMHI